MRRCEVCDKKAEVYVCASTMGAVSFGYCEDCLKNGLEPYWAVVSYIACAGRFPDDINEMYRAEVRRILKGLNKSEEQFILDVDKEIKMMDDYFNMPVEEE